MAVVIFDLGNVLIPYNHQKTVAATAALLQLDVETVQSIYAGMAEAIGLGHLGARDICRAFLEQSNAADVTCEEFTLAFAAGIEPDDAALRYAVLLQELPGVEVAVISNTNAVHVAWLDEHVAELAEVELVIMSNEVAYLKPDPEIFDLALELLDVAPADAIFVDDNADNVVAAQALGIRAFVHVGWKATRATIEAWLNERGTAVGPLKQLEF